MKILWVCNGVLPKIANVIGCTSLISGGWLTGISENLVKSNDINLIICFPWKNIISGEIQEYKYCSFKKEKDVFSQFEQVLKKYEPDVVHIFGTEYEHCFDIINACEHFNVLNKVVISIQGLVSVIANHYTAFLPEKVITSYSLRDFLKNSNIKKEQLEFKKRGIAEINALKKVRYVIGRTDWDKACSLSINKNLKYFKCNEILRKSFYENEWEIDKCEEHSILVSQSYYPLKGFHLMLEAMKEIVKSYPDAKLYTTGKNLMKLTFKEKLKQTYYSKYIRKLIEKYNLEKNVVFLGPLNEEEMCQQFLKSNVFVCCSSIENSPNSVGEAMILGVPTVASDVGGVKNMLVHNEEGFVYQADAPYMLAFYVKKLFEDCQLQKSFSEKSKLHANIIYDVKKNTQDLIDVYERVIGEI